MADRHDFIVSQYRSSLGRKGFKIVQQSPFVDYRPDIYATKGRAKVFVEVEIEGTLNGRHTLNQIVTMHRYLTKNKRDSGCLIVPRRSREEARFMIESIFGDSRIRVIGL